MFTDVNFFPRYQFVRLVRFHKCLFCGCHCNDKSQVQKSFFISVFRS